MTEENGRFWITFNGEIYNYRELRRDLEKRGSAVLRPYRILKCCYALTRSTVRMCRHI